MSTPDQPGGPGLTRKQLREIRMTGATPIVNPDADAPSIDEPADDTVSEVAAPEATAPEMAEPEQGPVAPPVSAVPSAPTESASPAVPLPRAAVPVVASPLPTPDAQVDLGVSPLTRRQAREQERIRTASVPVITPDVAAPPAGSEWAPPVPVPAVGSDAEADAAPTEPAEAEAPEAEPENAVVESAEASDAEPRAAVGETDVDELPAPDFAVDAASEAVPADEETPADAPAEPVAADEPASESDAPVDVEERPVLRPEFGSTLLAGATAAEPLAPSFDELIARGASSTGSVSTSNALILSQSPAGPLTSPVTATGEVLITGTFSLPEGLGSQGHAHGTTDGKEADSVLIDGELPPASSPTPIAASAAISTVKGTGEIIRPPAPEKGNKLMLGLAITAGVLAVALVGVLILAFVTGVF